VGGTLAYFTPAGGIALLEIERGDSRVLIDPPPGTDGYPGYENTLRWSPDGRQLAVTAGDLESDVWHLVRIDVSTGAVATVATTQDCCAMRSSWAPDADRIAYSAFERGYRRILGHQGGRTSSEISDNSWRRCRGAS
jgi:Tol biopolymer transport system component